MAHQESFVDPKSNARAKVLRSTSSIQGADFA